MILYLKHRLKKVWVLLRGKPKVFVIGMNKTGTTSIKQVLNEAGLLVGDQRVAERLVPYVAKEDYNKLIDYCQTAEAFQDTPFSIPGIYRVLDQTFPNSKFILSLRSDASEWFESLLRFHTKRFANGDHPPSPSDLEKANYVWPGWVYQVDRLIFQNCSLYNQAQYEEVYQKHIEDVRKYFRGTQNLIEVNVKNDQDLHKMIKFLKVNSKRKRFPHLNTSR